MTENMLSCAALKELLPFTFSVQVRYSALFSQQSSCATSLAAVGVAHVVHFKSSVTLVVAFKQSIILVCLPRQCSNVLTCTVVCR